MSARPPLDPGDARDPAPPPPWRGAPGKTDERVTSGRVLSRHEGSSVGDGKGARVRKPRSSRDGSGWRGRAAPVTCSGRRDSKSPSVLREAAAPSLRQAVHGPRRQLGFRRGVSCHRPRVRARVLLRVRRCHVRLGSSRSGLLSTRFRERLGEARRREPRGPCRSLPMRVPHAQLASGGGGVCLSGKSSVAAKHSGGACWSESPRGGFLAVRARAGYVTPLGPWFLLRKTR